VRKSLLDGPARQAASPGLKDSSLWSCAGFRHFDRWWSACPFSVLRVDSKIAACQEDIGSGLGTATAACLDAGPFFNVPEADRPCCTPAS
jgi:hypothetical protein